VKFSMTPGQVGTAAPLIGEHSKEILSKLLNYSDEDIGKLEEEGVISSTK